MRCNHSWLTLAENFLLCILSCCTPTNVHIQFHKPQNCLCMQQLEHAKCSIWTHQSLKAKHQANPEPSKPQLWANGWAWTTKPFWAAATYLVFTSTMQSPNLALPKAAGTKEWARAPCVSEPAMHMAEEQQGLGMKRIPWNLPLFEHRQTSMNFLLRTKERRKKKILRPWQHFLSFTCNKQMLISHYSEPLNTLLQNASAAAQLSGAKQVIILRTEMQLNPNLQTNTEWFELDKVGLQLQQTGDTSAPGHSCLVIPKPLGFKREAGDNTGSFCRCDCLRT